MTYSGDESLKATVEAFLAGTDIFTALRSTVALVATLADLILVLFQGTMNYQNV